MKKVLAILFVLSLFSGNIGPVMSKDTELTGAGATFPYPLYSKMFDAYHKEKGVQVNYQPIGSGGGQLQLINRTVDFGASDAYMSDEQLAKVPAKVVHIPTCVGAVVLSYNLPGSPPLRFTPEIISDIFLGKVTKWNDPEIKKANPSFGLPDMNILAVHRSDGSGTNFIFTHYLSRVSIDWKMKVGEGLSVNWPNGLGAKGNAGVAGIVKQTPGALGYVELIYALQNSMPFGEIKNRRGNFVKPSLQSAEFAANVPLPSDTRAFIADTDSPKGYPLSGFTWLLVYQEQDYNHRSKAEAESVAQLLWWMTHEGQRYASALDYAPLPPKALTKVERVLASITYDGKPLLKGHEAKMGRRG